MKVLAFGEILFDIIEGNNYLGGAPLNFAVHLRMLGADSSIISRVGNDDLGKEALRQLERLNVKTNLVQTDNSFPTGTVSVFLLNGQPDYEIFNNVAYDHIQYKEGEKLEEQFDVLYFGTLAQRNDISRNSLRTLIGNNSFKKIFYDINLRKGFYSKELLSASMHLCNILKLNDDEVNVLSRMLYGQQLDLEGFCQIVTKEFGIELVVVTAGGSGCYIFEDGSLKFVKGYKVKVVDTVGAGDSFSAAFLYFYFHGKGAVRSAEAANRLGSFVAGSRGPIPSYSPELKLALQL